MLSRLVLLSALAFVAEGGVIPRQSTIAAEQIYYAYGGCNPVSRSGGVTFNMNVCQQLNPSGLGLGALTSVTLTAVANATCSVYYYTNKICSPGRGQEDQRLGTLNQCVQANAPFLSTEVKCPL